MKDALVFDIQRFSVHDGPGIRTTVFFKGCSLSCQWCHNPEGLDLNPIIRYDRRLCGYCGRCAERCPAGGITVTPDGVRIERDKCLKCGTCASACIPKALKLSGKLYTIDQLWDQVRRDRPFYATSGGGVTLSGGEPLLQFEQAAALLQKCHEEGVNTAIETAGNYPWSHLEAVLPHCDTIHFDIKGWDPEVCKRCIGSDNKRIIENLTKLDQAISEMKKKPALIVRTPIIPDYNFSVEDYKNLAEFLLTLKNLTRLELIPFHNFGEPKYQQVDKDYCFLGWKNVHAEDLKAYKEAAEATGLPVSITSW